MGASKINSQVTMKVHSCQDTSVGSSYSLVPFSKSKILLKWHLSVKNNHHSVASGYFTLQTCSKSCVMLPSHVASTPIWSSQSEFQWRASDEAMVPRWKVKTTTTRKRLHTSLVYVMLWEHLQQRMSQMWSACAKSNSAKSLDPILSTFSQNILRCSCVKIV